MDHYRVEFVSARNGEPEHIRVSYLGGVGLNRDDSICGFYSNLSATPEWIQERVAALSIVDPPHTVVGVGQRIQSKVYWIEELASS